jgi:nickel superoxide dismutase
VRKVLTVLAALTLLVSVRVVLAHCEIPCGIYGDQMRIDMLREDITTVEKSMKMIEELSAEDKPNHNQLIRWVVNKEAHANKIQEIVTQYFMTQRVKLPKEGDEAAQKKYVRQLSLLHDLLVTAMKMKQTTDLAHVEHARAVVDDFAAAYFGPAEKEHLKEHGK